MERKVLNCDDYAEFEFSDRFVSIMLFNDFDTIFNHFHKHQISTVEGYNIVLNNKTIPLEFTEAFYDLLWFIYYEDNKEKVSELERYSDIESPSGSHQLQARVLQKVKEDGYQGLLDSCGDLLWDITSGCEHMGVKIGI